MGTAGETRAWVIDHIVWSELKLTAILGVQRVDAEVADRLREILEHLDAALYHEDAHAVPAGDGQPTLPFAARWGR